MRLALTEMGLLRLYWLASFGAGGDVRFPGRGYTAHKGWAIVTAADGVYSRPCFATVVLHR